MQRYIYVTFLTPFFFLTDGSGEIRGEGSVNVGLQLAQVDLDELVVLAALVGLKQGLLVLVGLGGDVRPETRDGLCFLSLETKLIFVLPVGGLEVVPHPAVVGED